MSKYASTALASFMCAAETGSFAAAGKTLGISAAAVGQNVKRLEREQGIKLFNRTTRHMSLTPEGSLLFNRAKGPLQALEEIDNVFLESKRIVSGPLRLSAPKRFAQQTLVPILAEFLKLHPKVTVDLDASDNVRDLAKDPVDIAIRIGVPSDSTMIVRPLSRLPVYTFASPEYVEKHGKPTHIQDLVYHNCLQYRFPTSNETWAWAFSIDKQLKRIPTKGTMIFNDPECLLAAGRNGAGLFQLDLFHGQDDVRKGNIVPVMPEYAAHMQSLYLCYASREHMPLRNRAFIDYVLSVIESDAYVLKPEV